MCCCFWGLRGFCIWNFLGFGFARANCVHACESKERFNWSFKLVLFLVGLLGWSWLLSKKKVGLFF
jgi:hypothetical protein